MSTLLDNLSYKFYVIALTENWLDEHDVHCFDIEGYEVLHIVREFKKGGGCSIYINNSVKFNIVKNICFTVNDEIECASVELDMGKDKNVTVCCVYRAPGGPADVFNEKFEDMINTISESHKLTYICGDFNLDLLQCESHHSTHQFVDIMFGAGFYPLITKPSHITDLSATFIDNILTNDLTMINKAGLLISDISDHLPIFVCSGEKIQLKRACVYQYKRVLNNSNINELLTLLHKRDWTEVQQCTDVNKAYSVFIDSFTADFNKCCPVKKLKVKETSKAKPWFTKGLENACKKKKKFKQTLS